MTSAHWLAAYVVPGLALAAIARYYARRSFETRRPGRLVVAAEVIYIVATWPGLSLLLAWAWLMTRGGRGR